MEENPQLSDYALMALQSFYDEQKLLQDRLIRFRSDPDVVEMDLLKEDWQLSQFWYSKETAGFLADFLLSSASLAACISAPTAFAEYKKKKNVDDHSAKCYLLEYDMRFKIFGESFIPYDYHTPLNIATKISANSADSILADPPFLSEECLLKTCVTIRYIAKQNARIMICTGAIMGEFLKRIMPNLRLTNFNPEHRSGLSNEFKCFTNFENEKIKWVDF